MSLRLIDLERDRERELRRLKQRRAAERQRERASVLGKLVLALIGAAICAWQITQPQGSFVFIVLGICLMTPAVAAWLDV